MVMLGDQMANQSKTSWPQIWSVWETGLNHIRLPKLFMLVYPGFFSYLDLALFCHTIFILH